MVLLRVGSLRWLALRALHSASPSLCFTLGRGTTLSLCFGGHHDGGGGGGDGDSGRNVTLE